MTSDNLRRNIIYYLGSFFTSAFSVYEAKTLVRRVFCGKFSRKPGAHFSFTRNRNEPWGFHGLLYFLVKEKTGTGFSKALDEKKPSLPRYLFVAFHDTKKPTRTKTLKRHNIAPCARMSVTTSRFMIELVGQNTDGKNARKEWR